MYMGWDQIAEAKQCESSAQARLLKSSITFRSRADMLSSMIHHRQLHLIKSIRKIRKNIAANNTYSMHTGYRNAFDNELSSCKEKFGEISDKYTLYILSM